MNEQLKEALDQVDFSIEDIDVLIEAIKWSINSTIDDFPLAGDSVMVLDYRLTSKILIDDIDILQGQLFALKRLLLIRQVLDGENS